MDPPKKTARDYKTPKVPDFGKLPGDYVLDQDGKEVLDEDGCRVRSDGLKERQAAYEAEREEFYPSPATRKRQSDALKATDPVGHFYSSYATIGAADKGTIDTLMDEWEAFVKGNNMGLKYGVAVCKAIEIAFLDRDRSGWSYWAKRVKTFAQQKPLAKARSISDLKEACAKTQERLRKAAEAHPIVKKAKLASTNLQDELKSFHAQLKLQCDEWTHQLALKSYGENSTYAQSVANDSSNKHSVWTDEYSKKHAIPAAPPSMIPAAPPLAISAAPPSESTNDILRKALNAVESDSDNAYYGVASWALRKCLEAPATKDINHPTYWGEKDKLFVGCGGWLSTNSVEKFRDSSIRKAKEAMSEQKDSDDEMGGIKGEEGVEEAAKGEAGEGEAGEGEAAAE